VPKATYATPSSTLSRQYNDVINGHRYDYADLNAYNTYGPERFQNTILVGVGGGQEFSNNSRFAFGPNVLPAVTLINPILNQTPAYPADGTAIQSQRNVLSALGEYASDQIKLYGPGPHHARHPERPADRPTASTSSFRPRLRM